MNKKWRIVSRNTICSSKTKQTKKRLLNKTLKLNKSTANSLKKIDKMKGK